MAKKKARKSRSTKGKAKPPADLVTRRVLADRLGKHPMTITKWEQEGLPIAKRGSRGRASFYREVDVRAWLQVRDEAAKQPGAVNLVQERARKERAQAVLAEQAYSIRMRDLLPREEVEKIWAAEVAAVRTTLLGWSQTLADKILRVATLEGLPGVERVLEDAVRAVLVELADPDRPPSGASPPSGQAIGAAA